MSDIKWIAEIGANHNQSINRIAELLDIARTLGCWGAKFQMFDVNRLFRYEKDRNRNKHNELPRIFVNEIYERCKALDLKFGCTPFDIDAVRILEPYVDFFKISSYELLRINFIKHIYQTGIDLILSSGMLTEIELNSLIYDITQSDPNNLKPIDILHCIADYPANYEDCNLNVISTYKDIYEGDIGWSDHTREPAVIYQAIASGASIIEFHLDLEDEKGFEYKYGHCWKPSEIHTVIETGNKMIIAKGNRYKHLSKKELYNKKLRASPIDGMRPLLKQADNE